jgi:hypothetical protein
MWRVKHPRVLLAAGVVVVAVLAAVLALPHFGGTPEHVGAARTSAARPAGVLRATLTLEQYNQPATGDSELLVSSPGPQFNLADQLTGTPVVWLRCFDRAGKRVIRYPYDWPLLEEPGYPPHIHHPATQQLLRRVYRCDVTGPGIDFEGTVEGSLPIAG